MILLPDIIETVYFCFLTENKFISDKTTTYLNTSV